MPKRGWSKISAGTPARRISKPQTPRSLSALRAVHELDWTDPPPVREEPPDVVIASDCTYWQHLFVPFCRTLLLTCGPETVVLLAHEDRRPGVELEVFNTLKEDFEVVLLDEQDRGGSATLSPVRVYRLQFRSNCARDLRQRQQEVMAQIEFEREDPKSLLDRLMMIENDMESIAVE
eukprot:CAMPEP_0177795782 /NCGR_PEP_ID=MMETSP0491_2-20121128/26427_1 /TAXON_ID=63592 /ORGANISM="Tetraselmis chuii, Strain PLY429" /LENGTH=176 /DNA_ID=CAMNT_0019318657 /DNA_START=90 /DNA_END=620 /DNA_ORIENTATION=-